MSKSTLNKIEKFVRKETIVEDIEFTNTFSIELIILVMEKKYLMPN